MVSCVLVPRCVRKLSSHHARGRSPATTMQKSSLPLQRRLLLSPYREVPEIRVRNGFKFAMHANSKRVSPRVLCYQVRDSRPLFRGSERRAPKTGPPWLGRRDSNPGMAVPKTAALPLGDAPVQGGG